MNTLPKRDSLPAVTAAGVVAIIFSALGVLLGLLVEVSMLVAPGMQLQRRPRLAWFHKSGGSNFLAFWFGYRGLWLFRWHRRSSATQLGPDHDAYLGRHHGCAFGYLDSFYFPGF